MEPTKHTGLTLKLPPLKDGKLAWKAQQNVEKSTQLRPVKLKPLKEVLMKLIAQFKRKDNYAFFLAPVDTAQVPAYLDVIKHPMDFGTMERKVTANRYRSLEEFSNDFRLVISNATTFNLPATLYHIEALRLSTYGLEQISKAASTVIQYETDWNIEVVDDETHTPVENEPPESALARTESGRSPSVQPPQPTSGRRALRGQTNKRAPTNTNTKPEANNLHNQIIDGQLPGSFDGIGAFPAGSPLSRLMVDLKVKGRRHRRKRDRIRIERVGPPYCADGSLDYFAMEHPFSILSTLVPDPQKKPMLSPLYTPRQSSDRPQPGVSSAGNVTLSEPSTSHSANDTLSVKSGLQETTFSRSSCTEPPQAMPTSDSMNGTQDIIAHHSRLGKSRKRPFSSVYSSDSDSSSVSKPKVKHWTIARNVYARTLKKEFEDKESPEVELAREATSRDWGCYPMVPDGDQSWMSDEGYGGRGHDHNHKGIVELDWDPQTYWTLLRAKEGELYVRDLVYGGWVGLAIARSMAEFCKPDLPNETKVESHPGLGKPCGEVISEDQGEDQENSAWGLGMSLADHVRSRILNPLTGGLHDILYQAGLSLETLPSCSSTLHASAASLPSSAVPTRVDVCQMSHPQLAYLADTLRQPIDIMSLVREPSDLIEDEKVWVCKNTPATRVAREGKCVMQAEHAPDVHGGILGRDELELADGPQTDHAQDQVVASGNDMAGDSKLLDPNTLDSVEMLQSILDYAEQTLLELDRRVTHVKATAPLEKVKLEGDAKMDISEEPLLQKVRLNLLALAQRVPLDRIADVPKGLAPEYAHQLLPTASG